MTYGGSANYTMVYLVPFGRYTWEAACMHMGAGLYPLAMPAIGYVLFGKTFFCHVTKPMVWVGTQWDHGPYWNILLFSSEINTVVDISADKRYEKKTKKKPRENRIFS